jgi:hypothetical protein
MPLLPDDYSIPVNVVTGPVPNSPVYFWAGVNDEILPALNGGRYLLRRVTLTLDKYSGTAGTAYLQLNVMPGMINPLADTICFLAVRSQTRAYLSQSLNYLLEPGVKLSIESGLVGGDLVSKAWNVHYQKVYDDNR